MIVTRLEFEDGKGIYHYDERNPKYDLRQVIGSKNTTRHPVPQDDTKLVNQAKDKFPKLPLGFLLHTSCYGFESAKQLFRWFYDEPMLRKMAEHGVRIAEYEVPDKDCLVGNTQVCFGFWNHVPEQLVKSYTIPEYLDLHREDMGEPPKEDKVVPVTYKPEEK